MLACPVPPGVECADFPDTSDTNLRVSILSRGVSGQAVFSCPAGFGLVGQTHTVCQANGEWAGPYPTCKGCHLWPQYGTRVLYKWQRNGGKCRGENELP